MAAPYEKYDTFDCVRSAHCSVTLLNEVYRGSANSIVSLHSSAWIKTEEGVSTARSALRKVSSWKELFLMRKHCYPCTRLGSGSSSGSADGSCRSHPFYQRGPTTYIT